MVTYRILFFITLMTGRSMIVTQQTRAIDCPHHSLQLEGFKPRLYQAIIIYGNSNETLGSVDELIQHIWTEVPTTKLNDSTVFSNYTSLSLLNIAKIGYASNLFVFVSISNLSYILNSINYAFEISHWSMHRQKFLILSSSEVHRDILKYAWTKWQLLDLTIFQTADYTIHQYNPFIDKYETNTCGKDIQWFPDKLKNLQSYTLTAYIQDDPPFCHIERNETGHVIESSGTEFKIMELLAKMMNFRVKLLVNAGPRFCNNGTIDADYCFHELNRRRVDFFANHRPLKFVISIKIPATFSRALFISVACPVVPVLLYESINDSRQSAVLMFGMAVLLFSITLAARFGNSLDRHIWTENNMTRLFLGFSINQTVDKTADRVLFISLIVASSIYTTILFNEFMSNALEIETEVDFNDFGEFKKWGITPLTDYSVAPSNHWILYKSGAMSDGINVSHWGTKKNCLDQLTRYKNVSCVMGQLEGKGAILYDAFKRNKRGEKRSMKMMKRCLWSSMATITMLKGSPYVGKVNTDLELIRQSGLDVRMVKEDLWQLAFNNSDSDDNREMVQLSSEHMSHVLLNLGWQLYFLNVLIFLAELLFHKVVRYKKRNELRSNLLKPRLVTRARKNHKAKRSPIDVQSRITSLSQTL